MSRSSRKCSWIIQNLAKPPLMRICRGFENWRDLSGKFLRQKSCYPESFHFLRLCSADVSNFRSSLLYHIKESPLCPARLHFSHHAKQSRGIKYPSGTHQVSDRYHTSAIDQTVASKCWQNSASKCWHICCSNIIKSKQVSTMKSAGCSGSPPGQQYWLCKQVGRQTLL